MPAEDIVVTGSFIKAEYEEDDGEMNLLERFLQSLRYMKATEPSAE